MTTPEPALDRLTDILESARNDGVFSAARMRVLHRGEVVHDSAHGHTRKARPAREIKADSIFDLASLTKPLATATLAAIFTERGLLDPDAPVAQVLPAFRNGMRESVTPRLLLLHAAGFPAWKPYYETISKLSDPSERREALFRRVMEEPLEFEPGSRSVYSDLDFILLGRLLEELGEKRLDALFDECIAEPLGLSDLFFLPLYEHNNDDKIRGRAVAATEIHPQRGELVGMVHDDNAHAGGGVFGHAGLFGGAAGVATVLEVWRRAVSGESGLISTKTARNFVFPDPTVVRGSFCLGWDRPAWKVSQAGRYASPHAIGHLGFTGTSAWTDFDRELTVVLLTNRVHPSREEDRIGALRKSVHEQVYEILGLTGPGPYKTPPTPENTKEIHMVGVAGTGMGSLAGMLKEAGYSVRGSDQAVYPPMSDFLKDKDIPVRQPFGPQNLRPAPDLCIVGNVCTRDHEEVAAIRREGLAYDSFPGVLERFFLADKKPLVAAGTHGKTTTSAMLAWLLHHQNMDPGFMIGGLTKNFDSNYRLGRGEYFVVEGDEYDSAYFDKNPKFLHYRPFGAVLTSIEFDHADIYDSLEEIESRFHEFARLIPEDGALAACWDYETVRRAASHARCEVLAYGRHPEARWRAASVVRDTEGQSFDLMRENESLARIRLPMSGAHNLENALGAAALLVHLGFAPEHLDAAFRSFQGVARRQQVRGVVGGVRVIDDFAHHPTAVRLTLEGLRDLYPQGRLLAAFDPRTNTSSRRFFQEAFGAAFESAHFVAIGNPSRMDRIAPEERLDPGKLARTIASTGVPAHHIPDIDEMAARLAAEARPGDSIAVLSNGGFGGLHEKILELLKDRHE